MGDLRTNWGRDESGEWELEEEGGGGDVDEENESGGEDGES